MSPVRSFFSSHSALTIYNAKKGKGVVLNTRGDFTLSFFLSH
jgi:hypothetical protein